MEYHFDFDDQLPDLPIAFDLDAVSQVFEEKLLRVGPSGDGNGVVKVTALQDLKYQPAKRCVTTYEIILNHPGAAPIRTIGVLEFTPDGVIPRFFQDDSRLSKMTAAMDPEEMRRRFTDLVDRDGGQVKAFSTIEIEPVRYKPGLHCVFRYKTLALSGERQVFYGKLFNEKSGPLMNTITSLHEMSEVNPALPHIPRPLAHWPDLQMILQTEVEQGIEFTKYAYDTSVDASIREEWMHRIGTATAIFHQLTVPGERKTIQDDLRDLREYTIAMEKVKPVLAKKFEGVIDQIIDRVRDRVEPEPVASHGALRTDQFLLEGDHLAMIDLDGYCWANPARDLGNFLAYLCWKAIRQPEHGQFVERAGRAFLESYLEVHGDIEEMWLSIYQAASLLKIAGRRFRNLTFREWPLIIHLIEAATDSLKEDLSDLEPGRIEDRRGILVSHLSTSTSKTKFPATFIDKEFPALWSALNSDMMNRELRSILSPLSRTGEQPMVRRAKLLAYKPGKRGVIRYDIEDGLSPRPEPVFGKLYPELYMCERAYRAMKILSDEVYCETPDLGVPIPLGYVPHLSMLVFLPAEGTFLNDAISGRQLDSQRAVRTLELAGSWLAQLHTHKFAWEKQFMVENEIDNIQEWREIIAKKYPEEGRAANHLADYLIEQATRLDFAMDTPIHKDFHYEHILINGGLKVFDFDEIRLGDPNFDLAHFCANFYLLAYRNYHHTLQFSNLQNHFFDTYSRITGWQMGEKFLFFYIYSCLKIAKQLCKLRGPRPWPEGEEQRAQVWLILEQGLVSLAQVKAWNKHEQMSLPMYDFSKIRRVGWIKASRISRLDISSEATRVSHRPLS